MIKDIVVNLTIGVGRDSAAIYAVSLANMEFENITSDIFNVFPDPTSPQNIEAKGATTAALKATAVADFEGIAIHCAQNSKVCGAAGAPDLLPDEPRGYNGFNGRLARSSSSPMAPTMRPARSTSATRR